MSITILLAAMTIWRLLYSIFDPYAWLFGFFLFCSIKGDRDLKRKGEERYRWAESIWKTLACLFVGFCFWTLADKQIAIVLSIILFIAWIILRDNPKVQKKSGFDPILFDAKPVDPYKSTTDEVGRNYVYQHRGLWYHEVFEREDFHAFLTEEDCEMGSGHVILGQLDHAGRVIGGFMIFNRKLISSHKRGIKNKIYKRNDEVRRKANVPGFDTVKSEWVELSSGKFPLYHRTHLLPFRFCLNDGEFLTIMFAGSAKLNVGFNRKTGKNPTNEDHERNKSCILSRIRRDRYYYMDPAQTSDYSLDDFERVADDWIYQDPELYDDVYQYGVECFYDDGRTIPTRVQVVFRNLTRNRLIFSAMFLNEK